MWVFDNGLLGSMVFWGALVLIVFFSSYFRYRTRASHYRMLERLAEKGQTAPPERLNRIDSEKQE